MPRHLLATYAWGAGAWRILNASIKSSKWRTRDTLSPLVQDQEKEKQKQKQKQMGDEWVMGGWGRELS
jgi:hypothetical protein